MKRILQTLLLCGVVSGAEIVDVTDDLARLRELFQHEPVDLDEIEAEQRH